MEKMKILFNFIIMNVYIIGFIDISENIHMICTLAQSHRLARPNRNKQGPIYKLQVYIKYSNPISRPIV